MLIDEIYQYTLTTPYMKKAGSELDKKIEVMLSRERESMSIQEYEKFRDRFYSVEFDSQRAGFIAGFRYAMLLMKECEAFGLEDFDNL